MSDEKMMRKGGTVKSLAATDDEMALINELTLEPLDAGQVFTFKVAACDNDIDRDFERFDDAALAKMAELFNGRTFIKDHKWGSDNQIARIYDAHVEDVAGKTADGLPLRQLVVKCYMLDNESNKDAIADIKAGIKKEVSVGFRAGSVVCSICGTDNRKAWCEHRWGKEYDGETCHFTLSDIEDCYELSFVAVPAQRNAGTKKEYLVDQEDQDPIDPIEKKETEEGADDGSFSFALELARAYVETF